MFSELVPMNIKYAKPKLRGYGACPLEVTLPDMQKHGKWWSFSLQTFLKLRRLEASYISIEG